MSEPAAEPPARPRYREGQVLQAQDLLDEQAYRIRERRCHAIGEHRWGIAQGLGLVTRNDGGITLQPGAAVDGYGRTLLVPGPVEVPASVLDTYGPMVDLWLGYCREPVTPAQRGTWACGPGRDSRWRERAVLRLSPAAAEVDPRRPPGVPPPDLDFPPHQAPPDDPARQWPVYLGRLDTQTGSVGGARPYIGLVGDTVAAPSGRARMQVGDEGRFAVGVTGPGNSRRNRVGSARRDRANRQARRRHHRNDGHRAHDSGRLAQPRGGSSGRHRPEPYRPRAHAQPGNGRAVDDTPYRRPGPAAAHRDP